MYGYLVPAKRWRTRQEQMLGLAVMRLETGDTGPNRLERRMRRTGVDRLLEREPTVMLWRERAPECCRLLLERAGITPGQATVEFFCRSPLPVSSILPFLPHVKHISLSAPNDDALAWTLQREFGVAAQRGAGDLAVCYSPARRSLSLPLYEPQPRVAGLELWAPGLVLPPDCPTQGAIAALVSRGRLEGTEVKIRANFS